MRTGGEGGTADGKGGGGEGGGGEGGGLGLGTPHTDQAASDSPPAILSPSLQQLHLLLLSRHMIARPSHLSTLCDEVRHSCWSLKVWVSVRAGLRTVPHFWPE